MKVLDIVHYLQVSRFVPVTEEGINEILNNPVPKATISKQKWTLGIFHQWSNDYNSRVEEDRKTKPIHEMSNAELSTALRYFLSEVRKENGNRYPPQTLKGIVAMIQHHLNWNLNRGVSIFKDKEFAQAIAVLDGQMKLGDNLGLVKTPKRAVSISLSDEEEMWNNGSFGSSNPRQLLYTLLYHLGLHCSLRACEEHRDLEFGEFYFDFCSSLLLLFCLGNNSQLVLTLDSNRQEFIC